MDRKFSKHFQNVIGFAFIMVLLTLMGGITGMIYVHQLNKTVPFEMVLLLSNSMFIGIGQSLIFGVLLPLGFAFVGWSMRDHLAAKRVLWLSRSFRVYTTGALLTTIVHIYMNVALASMLMRGSADNLAAANADLFYGSPFLRAMLYSGSHIVLAAGTFWYAVILWKSLVDVRRAIESISAE